MPETFIDQINPTDLDTIVHLHNQVFRPTREREYFERRFAGRKGLIAMVARIERDAVGFYLGFEVKPETHYPWLIGVAKEVRRSGVATQLMHAGEGWAGDQGYQSVRFECDNRIRHFLHFGIANGYDIVGIRWDPERMSNLVIFEKSLGQDHDG